MIHIKLLFLLIFSMTCSAAQAQRGFDLGSILNAGKDIASATIHYMYLMEHLFLQH